MEVGSERTRANESFSFSFPPTTPAFVQERPRGHEAEWQLKHTSAQEQRLFFRYPRTVLLLDLGSAFAFAQRVLYLYFISSLLPSSSLPWVAPSFLPSSSFAPLPLGMRISLYGGTGVCLLVFVKFAYWL